MAGNGNWPVSVRFTSPFFVPKPHFSSTIEKIPVSTGKTGKFLPVMRRLKRSRKRPLERSRGGASQHIGLAVERGDQPVDARVLQDGGELGAAGRHLADRAVDIDVGDQPGIAVAP